MLGQRPRPSSPAALHDGQREVAGWGLRTAVRPLSSCSQAPRSRLEPVTRRQSDVGSGGREPVGRYSAACVRSISLPMELRDGGRDAEHDGASCGGRMQFRVLGPLEVDAGSGAIPLGGPKQRAVLAHLLLRANQLVPAETLVDEIWGDESPQQARNIIQTYVSHLRKALGHDRIQSHAPGYRLRLDPSELDATRFDALMRNARKALPVDPEIAVAALDDALAMWRGPALADLVDQPSLLVEAARLDQLRLEAQEVRIEGLLASGTQARAIGELETLLARHPWRESLWGLLMLAYYREGRQAEALGSYQRAREILADELGIDPSPELVKLHERILKQDPGLDLRGEPLRGYRLLEKIDDGPTGVVFRAIQPHVERDVAVKIFNEATAGAPEFVRRFDPDAQAIAALEHPHIAPIYDYWREPGRAYIVSRYLRGGSLRAIEERGERLERDRALRVVEQISLALAFAHRQGIAHGNVRSSNILFDLDGNAYLGDFLIGGGPALEPAEDVQGLAILVRALAAERNVLRWSWPRGLRSGRVHPRRMRSPWRPARPSNPRRWSASSSRRGTEPLQGPPGVHRGRRPRLLRARASSPGASSARLVETGPGSRFLAVVGPSGGGKSSVVRAGLVPAIRHGALGARKIPSSPRCSRSTPPRRARGRAPSDRGATCRPAARTARFRISRPARGGGSGRARAGGVVLVVDQFEEVFTLTTDEPERELFLQALRVAVADPESRLRVIVTLRADFYDRPLIYPRFGELLAERTEAVPPLTPDELEQAIRGPVERVGVLPEPGLVAEMIADVAHQPGALPLLQYALTELFERRDEDRLTLTAYRELGGITGALSARAERIFEATDQQGRRATKQTFLRLVTLGEGRQDTRRRVARSELDALDVDQEAIDTVVDTFGRHRLLTFDREPSTREPTVEIAHEALLSAWGRLRTWIDHAREDLRQERGLARATAEWRGADGDPSFLMRGARLDQLETWAAATDLAIGRPERAYLKASVDQREREHGEEERRREHEGRIDGDRHAGCAASLPSSRPRLSSPDRSPSSQRAKQQGAARDPGRDGEGARHRRGCEHRCRPGAQRPTREQGRRDDALIGRDRSPGSGGGAPPLRGGVATRPRGARGGGKPRLEPLGGLRDRRCRTTRASSTSGTARPETASTRSRGMTVTSPTSRSAPTARGSPPPETTAR